MRFMLILWTLALVGCGSTPTQYVSSSNNKEGYSDRIVDGELRVTTFKGNSATKLDKAELYAKFRAIQICEDVGRPYTHIFLVKDRSHTENVTQTSVVSPTYYYGMAPYYGGYGMYGTGMGISYNTGATQTTNETYNYPMYEVYFECTVKPLDARISLNNLSPSQMESMVMDKEGGVQVDEVLKDSPNAGKLQKADIISKVDGERVTKVLDVYKVSRKNNQKPLAVEFYRDGKKKETTVTFIDVTDMVAHAQKEIIKAACENDVIKDKQKICKK